MQRLCNGIIDILWSYAAPDVPPILSIVCWVRNATRDEDAKFFCTYQPDNYWFSYQVSYNLV